MFELPQIWQLVTLLGVHWVADFLCQTRWMAENKSKRIDALSAHVATYSVILALASLVLFGPSISLIWFILANAVLHFATDFVTSRMTTALWNSKNVYGFFAIIGLDQLLHQIALAATLVIFLDGG